MTRGDAELVRLVAGPTLFAVGVGVFWFVRGIGPLDVAKVQGFVGLPLLAAGPAVAGLAGKSEETRSRARVAIRAAAVLLGVFAALAIALTVRQVGCTPVTSPIQALPHGIVVGVLAGGSYWFAARSAMHRAERGNKWAALAVGAGTFIVATAVTVAFVFMVLFPPLSCAPPH